jgi:hypothetical protein
MNTMINTKRRSFCGKRSMAVLSLFALSLGALAADPDLWMRDSVNDTGFEPSPDEACWGSPDIWVQQDRIPGYTPDPFTVDPPWLTAAPAPQDPVYRDPRLGKPNYIYVRVGNLCAVNPVTGVCANTASFGTERLRVYWSKYNTSQTWPDSFVDAVGTRCGVANQLLGIEITKPRRNAATVGKDVRNQYIQAVLDAAAATASFPLENITYYNKQDQVYNLTGQNMRGGLFLPWHREFLNRFEILLRMQHPTVTLLYWDWTTDPASLMTPDFLGPVNAPVVAPAAVAPLFAPVDSAGCPICAQARQSIVFGVNPCGGPLSCWNTSAKDYLNPAANLYRKTLSTGRPPTGADSDSLAKGDFASLSQSVEANWSSACDFMGGGTFLGNLSTLPYNTEDPLFFLLTANADRLWAAWQRANNADVTKRPLDRLNSETAYAGIIVDPAKNTLHPWDGTTADPDPSSPATMPPASPYPWDSSANFQIAKNLKDASVVFPPVYDTSPVTVPVLQPGEFCIIEIPWYPPNPADFACDVPYGRGHTCLYARIETNNITDCSQGKAYGMNNCEKTGTGDDILHYNVRYNKRIIQRNVHIQDGPGGSTMSMGSDMQNKDTGPGGGQMKDTMLRMFIPTAEQGNSILNYGNFYLNLGPVLYSRWVTNGAPRGPGASISTNLLHPNSVQIKSFDTYVDHIPLLTGEVYQVTMQCELTNGYPNAGITNLHWTLEQISHTGFSNQVVGGITEEYRCDKLRIIRDGENWNYFCTNGPPPGNWTSAGYDDSHWPLATAPLGYGNNGNASAIPSGPADQHFITTYFRHPFTIDSQSPTNFYRNLYFLLRANCGAVVYLNGTEVFRRNLPGGTIDASTTATNNLSGLAENIFFVTNKSTLSTRSLLNPASVLQATNLVMGTNVVAVEAHQASPTNSDLMFDFQLWANYSGQFSPQIGFTQPAAGSMSLIGSNVTLAVETLDQVGSTTKLVSFYYKTSGSTNYQFIGSRSASPYSLAWTPPGVGTYQLWAEVLASPTLLTGNAFVSNIQIVSNLFPSIAITNIAPGTQFAAGSPLRVSGVASGANASIVQVILTLKEAITLDAQTQWSASGISPPVDFQITAPTKPSHYLLTATAVDEHGQAMDSTPVRIEVVAPPTLTIRESPPQVILNWTPSNATIEQRTNLSQGAWQVISNALPPLTITPVSPVMFFRARLP